MGYGLLVEDSLQKSVPEGILRYQDGEVRVPFTDEKRQWVQGIIFAIRTANVGGPTIFGAQKKAGQAAALFTDWAGFVRLVEPGAAKIYEKENDARGVVQQAMYYFIAARPALPLITKRSGRRMGCPARS